MNILTPASIGNVVLKNRIIFPSMCNFYCDAEGFVTEQLKAFVRARVEGGAGAIIMPGSPHGKPSPARPALSDPKYYEGWRALRDICHERDCRLFVQIHPAKAQAGARSVFAVARQHASGDDRGDCGKLCGLREGGA